jgi:hypothetical protein
MVLVFPDFNFVFWGYYFSKRITAVPLKNILLYANGDIAGISQ